MHELMHERTHTSQGTVERRSPRVVGLTRALRAATATAALVAPLAAPAQFVTGLQGPGTRPSRARRRRRTPARS